jgi:hypothetical protein
MFKKLYETKLGRHYVGKVEDILRSKKFEKYLDQGQLILTSPPFPLNEKKKYGNFKGEDYRKWFVDLSHTFSQLIKDDGSIVIELGNSWEPGRPIQSLLHLESLIGFVNNPEANLRLCQQFVCYNPSRLPSPAQWVTVNRIRTTDSFTHIWWMAKSDFPKADNKKILRPYGKDMEALLKRQKYNPGVRPSGHNIGTTSFLTDHKGSIMPNVLELESIRPGKEVRLPENVLKISNTTSNDYYIEQCRKKNMKPHPARMPIRLAALFISFLTDPGDIVLDLFAGSNTTGYCAEILGRRWITIEARQDYSEQSIIRFQDPAYKIRLRKYF